MFIPQSLLIATLLLPAWTTTIPTGHPPTTVTIKNDNSFIYYHGRWDTSPGTWWYVAQFRHFFRFWFRSFWLPFRASSGFKLNIQNLHSLTLNLGEHTTSPSAAVGVSIDGSDFTTVNVSTGVNTIPLPTKTQLISRSASTLVRINVQGWQNNRINLESIVLNSVIYLCSFSPIELTINMFSLGCCPTSIHASQTFLPIHW